MSIVRATQRSARALARAQRWYRRAADAVAREDYAEAERCERLYARAMREHRDAWQASRFPWEVRP